MLLINKIFHDGTNSVSGNNDIIQSNQGNTLPLTTFLWLGGTKTGYNSSNSYLKNILTSFNITNSIVKLHYYDVESYINSNTRNNILFVLGLNNLTDKLN